MNETVVGSTDDGLAEEAFGPVVKVEDRALKTSDARIFISSSSDAGGSGPAGQVVCEIFHQRSSRLN